MAYWYCGLPRPRSHAQAYIWVVTRHEIDYRGNVVEGDTHAPPVPEPLRGARFDREKTVAGAGRKVRPGAKTTWAILDRALAGLIRADGRGALFSS